LCSQDELNTGMGHVRIYCSHSRIDWLLSVMRIVTADMLESVLQFYTFHISNIYYHICAHVEVDCGVDGEVDYRR
jgi:hypothetical protein